MIVLETTGEKTKTYHSTENSFNMANTEGISDENLAKLLSININDHKNEARRIVEKKQGDMGVGVGVGAAAAATKSRRVPRGMLERQRMMDEFENSEEGTFQPSAKVIRTSNKRAPTIKSANGKGESRGRGRGSGGTLNRDNSGRGERPNANANANASSIVSENQQTANPTKKAKKEKESVKKSPPPPVLSESILERKIKPNISAGAGAPANKKVSKFKLRQQQQQQQQAEKKEISGTRTNNDKSTELGNGFPSFDIPVGALTRKGKIRIGNNSFNNDRNVNGTPTCTASQISNASRNASKSDSNVLVHEIGTAAAATPTDADKMLANMSDAEIQENVEEIEGMLSPETVQFLKKRHLNKKKEVAVTVTVTGKVQFTDETKNTGEANIPEKEKSTDDVSAILNNIISPAAIMDDEGEEESEIETASKLLRSTSPRQRILGAKNMCKLLEARVESQRSSTSSADSSQYPHLLPVALRCILDTPSPHKHPQLISYSMRCIYNLVLLFVPPCHRIHSKSLEGNGNDPNIIFQQDFMCDAVPIPSASELYSKEGLQLEKSSMGDGCYATNASAESADADAKSFYSDPAWILLSKMRIIPCLSHILSAHARIANQSKDTNSLLLSSETVTSICGILSTLCLRSPGAAVAVAQHQSLLPSITSLTLEPGSDRNERNFVVNTKLAFPTIYLCCVICRQSRSAAKSLESLMERVVYIIASKSDCVEEHRLQQWCIIFWRTLLRYGLALDYVPTILPLSVRCLACDSNANKSDEFSLGVEYLSAFSVICECVKIATMHKGFQAEVDKNVLRDSDRESLGMSGVWLSSHAQNCADDMIGFGADLARNMKLTSAKLRFLSLYFDVSSPSDIMGSVDRSENLAFVPLISLETFIAVLNSMIDSQVLLKALEKVQSNEHEPITDDSIVDEATAFSLIENFFSCFRILVDKMDKMMESRGEEKINSDIELEVSLLIQKSFAVAITLMNGLQRNPDESQLSRLKWTNKACCALGIFLSTSVSAQDSPDAAVLPLIQSFVLRLIGELQRGEESNAVLLFSQDIFFITESEQVNEKPQNAYLVQDVMTRELCSTALAQSQLDHSFKLHGRPGLTVKGKGHFTLESLRMQTDFKGSPSKSQEANSEPEAHILPLGLNWFWSLLSSSFAIDGTLSRNKQEKSLSNAIQIVSSTVRFALYIEKCNMPYAKMASTGAKVYFLLNACLNTERIISNESFEALFLQLFSQYQQKILEEGSQYAKAFVTACYKHSSQTKRHHADSAEDYDKMMNLFFNGGGAANEKAGLSSKHLKAIDDFVEDLTNSFIDFGAQYELFVRAIRFLLMPEMPVRVRIRVLDKLKDLLHLLTTESESEDVSGMQLKNILAQFYIGGLPEFDNSSRDDGAFLDALSRIIKTSHFSLVQRQNGFFYYLTIGCLARNLASNAIRCECGVKAMERRLKGVNTQIWRDIVNTANDCVRKQCDNSDELASIVILVCNNNESIDAAPAVSDDFECAVNKLRELHHAQRNNNM